MTMLLTCILAAVCALLSCLIGLSKGYQGGLSALCGFFGGIAAVLFFLVLPDRAREQEQQEATLSALHREIAALQQRITALEEAPSQQQDQPEAPPEPVIPVDPNLPVGRFDTRSREEISCPRCGKRQPGDRNLCYSCNLPFVYGDEENQ